jgi:hypothetical protein
MIRYAHKKSSETKNTIWMDMFNNFINNTAIIEMIRWGSRFTWIDMQESLVRSNLDMIFVSRGWEQQYSRVMILTLTRVSSDNNHIILDEGTNIVRGHKLFRFETAWLSQAEFER